ncbi:hypothetical protein FACS189493_2020 [Spirochaetia bacterium]|nr:hypothetical protein FACS189493_2020 [Spirochaetia bacterium]
MKNYKKGVLFGLVGIALAVGLVLAACESVYEVTPTAGTGTGKATVTLTDTTWKVSYDGKTADGSCKKTTSGTTDTYTDGTAFSATVSDGKLTTLSVNKSGIIIAFIGSQAKKSVDGEENTIDFDDIELIILDAAE